MKALFIHDHYFVHDKVNDKYYDGSGGSFTKYMWDRYLSVFDELLVIGREKENLPNKLVISSSNNVGFVLIDDIKSSKDKILKYKIIKKKIKTEIEKVDFVISRLPSTLGFFAIDICKEINKPYLIEVVGCPFDAYWNYGGMLTKVIAPIQYFKLRNYVKKSENIIYVTQKFLQSRYPNKKQTIGISNVNLKEVQNVGSVLSFYNKSFETFNIGLIGSFHVKYKGHVEAIKALKYLVNKGQKNIRLNLVGTGDSGWLLDIIQELNLNQFVNIIGLLEAGEKGILPFLDKQHLYIHPSKQEGLPRVVIEAMSRGRLVLGASVAGVPELLSEKFLHKPGDWKKLANQIEYIYSSKYMWEKMIKENIEIALKYKEGILQEKRVSFFKKIMNERN
ncbi:glycosyltransferase [Tenacibaculum tangerinum]|uniref:Glycosyltransferase n=1 Tax=Tenacibaculum tangerinum TaxID=3038772 RepID=A0ABY8L8Q8_9FLAO|nr:glycosyltransferase [Tenacibaculum tangerinum]WGH76982.1 glycosyltransferase [Tenacibaculum tangerinum]